MTDDVIANAESHLERITDDPRLALEPAARQATERLAALVVRDERNLTASYLLGRLRLAEAHALPAGDDAGRALGAALDALLLPFLAGMPPLPPELLPALADRAAETAQAWLKQAYESDDVRFVAVVADLCRRIADNTAPDHVDRAERLNTLGIACLRHASLSDSPPSAARAIDEAVDAQRRAGAAVTADGPERIAVLTNLCSALWTRFVRTGSRADLDEVVDAGRSLARQPTGDRRRRVQWLGQLANALHHRYELTGGQEDLDEELNLLFRCHMTIGDARTLAEVEEVARLAVAAAEPGTERHTERAAVLGTALRGRYFATQELPVFDEAIDVDRQVAEATPSGHPKYGLRHSYVGISLFSRFERTGDATDLDGSIAACRVAAATEVDQRQLMLVNLAVALHARYQRDHRLDDREEMIGAARRALAGTLTTDPKRRARAELFWGILRDTGGEDDTGAAEATLDEQIDVGEELLGGGGPAASEVVQGLADALHTRFVQRGRGEDLERAIAVLRGVGDDPQGLVRARLCWLLISRHSRTGDPADAADAVAAGRAAVRAAPDDDQRPGIRRYLAESLAHQARHSRDRATASEAVDIARHAFRETPTESAERPKAAFVLASTLSLYQDISGDLEALKEAIRVLGSLGTGIRPVDQILLANLLRHHFEQTGQSDSLDRAIRLSNKALDRMPTFDSVRQLALDARAFTLQAAFRYRGNLADLDAAIAVHRESVRLAERRNALGPHPLAGLGVALRMRYEHGGPPEDIDESVELLRRAVDGCAEDGPDRAVYLSDLGATLRTRSDRSDNLDDLDEAIAIGREATAAVSPGHTYWAGALSNLCTALQNSFRRRGSEPDLAEAIALARRAAELLDPADPDRAIVLSGLGSALATRFQRSGALADLNGAVGACRSAVAATPAGHPSRPGRLSNLVISLRERHIRTRAARDLHEAADAAAEAVRQLPHGHPYRLAAVSNLSGVLLNRAERMSGHGADLDTAIATIRESLVGVDSRTLGVADTLALLSAALRAAFDRDGEPAVLDEAIEVAQQAVDLTGTDNPARADRLTTLGIAAFKRYRRNRDAADLATAVAAFTEVPGLAASAPTVRIQGARAAAELTWRLHPGYAADLLDRAVRLLPETAPEPLDLRDRQYQLTRFAGLASDAAALALAAVTQAAPVSPVDRAGPDDGGTAIINFAGGHLTFLNAERSDEPAAMRAFRLLEQGRGVVLAQVLDSRTDLDDLRAEDPDLAGEYARLRVRLDTQPLPLAPAPLGPPLAADRHDLADEYVAVVARIRQLPGLAHFNEPPSATELLREARDGAVVMLNVGASCGHALLLTSADVTAVELPDLTVAAVAARVNAFREALRAIDDPGDDDLRAEAGQDTISATLEWLWDTVAGPVLDRLNPSGEAPRVWWVPGGALGLLPLHAAGYHRLPENERAGRSLLDRVVSSYTPTVRALRHARRQAARPDPALGALIVAVGDTEPPLPRAVLEAEAVGALLPQSTVLTPARTADVLARLSHYGIAHFVCHAVSDPDDPSAGRLLLHDDATDPLTVARLIPTDLRRSRLAYLSACRTAVTDAAALFDESIYLTSAFLLAGFPHVIGTLWTARDEESARVASAFYEKVRTADGTIDIRDVAWHLREAIRPLRDEYPGAPSLWAAYTHTGA